MHAAVDNGSLYYSSFMYVKTAARTSARVMNVNFHGQAMPRLFFISEKHMLSSKAVQESPTVSGNFRPLSGLCIKLYLISLMENCNGAWLHLPASTPKYCLLMYVSKWFVIYKYMLI